jgi:hypothetical protein
MSSLHQCVCIADQAKTDAIAVTARQSWVWGQGGEDEGGRGRTKNEGGGGGGGGGRRRRPTTTTKKKKWKRKKKRKKKKTKEEGTNRELHLLEVDQALLP